MKEVVKSSDLEKSVGKLEESSEKLEELNDESQEIEEEVEGAIFWALRILKGVFFN